ncbi:hypothetical protein DIURU_002503 [Diutina rugosa]|uniref:Aspartate aminotransferase n=1 Tax=Diutina rugosa TaxID=5481 RepID=A0A642UPN6_DIURU|nr:uncharacterized protein DIURU_002503 [Diutina rugosa]KAA8903216.1 hypothetical protein DIURU_002503 [Diutina rugosa]
MTQTSVFASLETEPADPIIQVMQAYAADADPNKIDVSIGVYFDENGKFVTYPSVAKAKVKLAQNDPGHNYHTMKGVPEFVAGAREVIFGKDRLQPNRIASQQAISGSGALHSAFNVITKQMQRKQFYVGVPTWGNYFSMISHVGGNPQSYQYYDDKAHQVAFSVIEETMKQAESGAVFVMQACCHNPTGADLTQEQWQTVAKLAKERNLLLVIDIAYQGFSSGSTETDAWPVRYLFDQGLEFFVCQSFSKNMGLYGERVGCVHAVAATPADAAAIESNLIVNFRSECSFAPAWGARVAATIFGDEQLKKEWADDVAAITNRLHGVRQQILELLTTKYKTPGYWDHVTRQHGLFWHSGLEPKHIERLRTEHHVYAVPTGRVNVAGLNENNVECFCRAVDEVVRHFL